MPFYTVSGYESVLKLMLVEADSEEEALEKAKEGEYVDADTEPGDNIWKNKWKVDSGPHSKRKDAPGGFNP